ncbi:MAG: RpiB/LacA/LacB family sugar-phosphate isomerase [Alphaproteobacteria bacterium]|nr:RpiB/LacA/LacB family sugar-phosphate isomerase [Alphaproteobacteria bacterium]
MSANIISIASDHRGFGLKTLFCASMKDRGITVEDFGPTTDATRCDAGDFSVKVVDSLRNQPERMGVLICGTGQVMALTSNRFAHIRGALCTNSTMVRLARQHNDANILILGAHIIGQEVALDCLNAFLTTDFLGGRYKDRLDKLTALGGL